MELTMGGVVSINRGVNVTAHQRHRHKRFHVPPEAKGIRYYRFLAVAPRRQSGEESASTNAELDTLEAERLVARRGMWFCVMALLCVMIWLWGRFGVSAILPILRPDLFPPP